MGFLEAGMLVCFGLSWPINVMKTFKSKCVLGKSILFSFLILLGYVFGIANKLLYSLDWVLWLYLVNIFFVLLDIFLYFLYRNNLPPALSAE